MEAILFLQETLILDQLVYAAGVALSRGRAGTAEAAGLGNTSPSEE